MLQRKVSQMTQQNSTWKHFAKVRDTAVIENLHCIGEALGSPLKEKKKVFPVLYKSSRQICIQKMS